MWAVHVIRCSPHASSLSSDRQLDQKQLFRDWPGQSFCTMLPRMYLDCLLAQLLLQLPAAGNYSWALSWAVPPPREIACFTDSDRHSHHHKGNVMTPAPEDLCAQAGRFGGRALRKKYGDFIH